MGKIGEIKQGTQHITSEMALNGGRGCGYKYQIYDKDYASAMVEIVNNMRRPLTTAELMRKRIEVLDASKETRHVWWSNGWGTSDGVVNRPDGRLKIVLDSTMLKEITPEKLNGECALNIEDYDNLPGKEFTKDVVSKGHSKKRTENGFIMSGFTELEGILENPVWRYLSRDDQDLLEDYFKAAFKMRKSFPTRPYNKCILPGYDPDDRWENVDLTKRSCGYTEYMDDGIMGISILEKVEKPELFCIGLSGSDGEFSKIIGRNGSMYHNGPTLIGMIDGVKRELDCMEKTLEVLFSKFPYFALKEIGRDRYIAIDETHKVMIGMPGVFEIGAQTGVTLIVDISEDEPTIESRIVELQRVKQIKDMLRSSSKIFSRFYYDSGDFLYGGNKGDISYRIPTESIDELRLVLEILSNTLEYQSKIQKAITVTR